MSSSSLILKLLPAGIETCPPLEKNAVIGEISVLAPRQIVPYASGNGDNSIVEPEPPRFIVKDSILPNNVRPQFPFLYIVWR